MIILPLASSSKGNCHYISDGQTSLLLEAGIPIKKIRERLNKIDSSILLTNIGACLVTHEHQDHSKAVMDICNIGIDVYMSIGTKQALKESYGVEHYKITSIKPLTQFKIGTFIILPFEAKHDCAEPFGFIIYSTVTKENLFFLNDSYYTEFIPRGCTHLMIECNYDENILQDRWERGEVSGVQRDRLLRSHFSIRHVCEFIEKMKEEGIFNTVEQIYLMHLSSDNSDAKEFKRTIQEISGVHVIVCPE